MSCRSLIGVPITLKHGFLEIHYSADDSYSWASSSYSCSPNGRYTIGFLNYPDFAKGIAWILIDGDKIISEGSLPASCEGRVLDTGRFVITGWARDNRPSEVFFVFSSSGEELIRHEVNAEIREVSISPDGSYAAFYTRYNREGPDFIFFFDIANRIYVWKHDVPFFWPEKFAFDDTAGILTVYDSKGRGYRFTYDGVFLDAMTLERDLARDQVEDMLESVYGGYPFYNLAMEEMDELNLEVASREDYVKAVDLLRWAVRMQMSDLTKARAYRLLGEIAEKFGRKDEAITCYESALDKNEKVGVKTRLKRLKSERAQTAGKDIQHDLITNSRHREEAKANLAAPEKTRSIGAYQVITGSKALETTDVWPTKHVPGPITLTAEEEVLWAPRYSKKTYVACQQAARVKWMTEVHGRPRQIAVAGNHIYVLMGNGYQDEGALSILDAGGGTLSVHTLPGYLGRISVNRHSGRALVVSRNALSGKAKAILIDGAKVVNSIECDPWYHWRTDVVSVSKERWVVNCQHQLLVIDEDGRIVGKVPAPPYSGNLSTIPLLLEDAISFSTSAEDSTHFSSEDAISFLVSDEDSRDAFILTRRSHRVYRLNGTELILHSWDKDNRISDLFYSENRGSTMLVRGERGGLHVHPSGSPVIKPNAFEHVHMWYVHKAVDGRRFVYSREDNNLFVCTSSFAIVNHMQSEEVIGDIVMDERGEHVYLAKRNIEVARFC